MRKIILFAAMAAMLLTGCADEKTFKKSDGTEFTAKPYGWMNREGRLRVWSMSYAREISYGVVFSARPW